MRLADKIMDIINKEIDLNEEEKKKIRERISVIININLPLEFFKSEVDFSLDSYDEKLNEDTIEEIAKELMTEDTIEQTIRDTVSEKINNYI